MPLSSEVPLATIENNTIITTSFFTNPLRRHSETKRTQTHAYPALPYKNEHSFRRYMHTHNVCAYNYTGRQ